MKRCALWPAVVLFCAWLGTALAAPLLVVALRPMPGQFPGVTEVTHAADGSDRLFVVTQPGAIWVMEKGSPPAAQPFLDITPRVASVGERGLLGLAFHPRFASNRRFFVFYTRIADGALQVSEFLASAADPNRADPASERPVLTIPHPLSNHNGGKLAFGPDGFLYIATGDGGGAFDPDNNAQNLNSLLGKILRIDVNPLTGYAIPPDNYFASNSGGRAEIWAYGLRNPWRFSFDRQTGDLYIADVGQGQVEEVNVVRREQIVPGTFPRNFEWDLFEGNLCVSPPCPPGGTPSFFYRHDPAGGTSITGGYVYRGMRSPGLAGWYIYGDFGNNRIWAARRAVQGTTSPLGTFQIAVLVETPNVVDGLSTFGEDEQGEVYVASIRDGRIYRIETAVAGENVAAAAAGGVAWASSEYSPSFAASAAIDGERAGRGWGAGSGWNDGTFRTWPDWLQVQFAGLRTIDRVVLYSLQDSPFDPVEPVDGMTFRNYGVQDFTIEGWTGSAWVQLARVANNMLVKRTVELAPVAVDRIFVHITRSLGGYSHLTEVEAWTPAARSEMNFAHARHGSTASASSNYSASFPPSAAIDGDRAGRNWGAGSGWNDGTFRAWPDWLQVHLGGLRTIDRVVVSTLQDNAMNPMEPSDYTGFTSYGIQDFTVEGWTGTSWVLLGRVTGNTSVMRHIGFAPVAVDRVFVHVTRSLGGYSHITEVEAWGAVGD